MTIEMSGIQRYQRVFEDETISISFGGRSFILKGKYPNVFFLEEGTKKDQIISRLISGNNRLIIDQIAFFSNPTARLTDVTIIRGDGSEVSLHDLGENQGFTMAEKKSERYKRQTIKPGNTVDVGGVIFRAK